MTNLDRSRRRRYPSLKVGFSVGTSLPADVYHVANADSGGTVVLNYSLHGYCSQFYLPYGSGPSSGCVPEEKDHRLVAISGGSIASDSSIDMADPQRNFAPILQAEDGMYFGTGVTAQNSMDAFDLSGNVKWSVPAFTPVMAAADAACSRRDAPNLLSKSCTNIGHDLGTPKEEAIVIAIVEARSGSCGGSNHECPRVSFLASSTVDNFVAVKAP